MFLGKIKKDGIEVCKISIPETDSEIKYGFYLDYTYLHDELIKWVLSQQEQKIDYQYQYLSKLAKAVSHIYQIDEKIMLNLKFGEMNWFPKAWARIENIIISYEAKESSDFEINGIKYSVPIITKTIFKGSANIPEMTIQQVNEIGECERVLSKQLKYLESIEHEYPEKGILKAQQVFNSTLKKFALILAEPKSIPTDQTFDIWIEGKARELINISFPDAMNLIFFLTDTGNDYMRLIGLNFISNLLKYANIDQRMESNIVIE